MYDIIIAGSGFCGSTIANLMANKQNKKVLIIEKRAHIAGNMYDERDKAGVIVHKYGPHIMHTSIEKVYRFLTSIGEWKNFSLKCGAVMDGKFSPTPFNFSTIETFFDTKKALHIKESLAGAFPGQKRVPVLELLASNNKLVREYAEFLFEKDYRPYTAKQWGVSPEEIDPSVLKRVPVCLSYENQYFSDTYQMMPVGGYTVFFEAMLDHPNIDIVTECNALNRVQLDQTNNALFFDGEKANCPFVYTGAIDELFDNAFGRLPYRSLRFDYQIHNTPSYQDTPVVAYPQEDGYTRITEYTKLPIQEAGGKTSIAVEYPLPVESGSDIEPYYPIPTDVTATQYARYLKLADSYPDLFLCGRLADYKYYNMDNAIARAFEVNESILAYWERRKEKE